MSSQKTTSNSGMVKKSTMIIVAVAAFATGLYGGYLTHALRNTAEQNQPVQKRSVTAQQPADSGQSENDIALKMQHDRDLMDLKLATQKDPQNPAVWNKLGHWYFDHDMPKEAIGAYESSLVLNPRDPDIITDLGVMYRDTHDHEKALELFRRAAGLSPTHLQSRFNIGIALMDLDRKQEAIAAWEEVRSLEPNFKLGNGSTITEWLKEMK